MSATLLELLRKLNDDYIASVASRDVGRFEELLADDFLNTNPDGTLVTRAQFLAQIARLSPTADLRCEDVLLRPMGDFAIVHGRTVYTKPDGQRGAGRYTDIWALRDGNWVCVAAQVMRG